jgi:glycosyltransferase involved in cell wall biosynthesis
LKWSYAAIRANQGEHIAEICIADDNSNDGTWEWCQQVLNDGDTHFKCIRNDGPNRLGHTILYDRLINEVASYDKCIIFHADMYLCPGALDEIEKYIGPKKIVSLTRIEPPLHPDGPEKFLADWGVEPEEFNESAFLQWFVSPEANGYKPKYDTTTDGIFAPWAFMKADFQEIGGHDPLYAPQSKEDSDIFNRFQLNGVEFIQTWKGCVYHMTCRGSRFNPTLTTPGKNSTEWEEQNKRSTRNFIRKWGHFVSHTDLLKPIIPPKYNIGFKINNCSINLLHALEPWCTVVYVGDNKLIEHYIADEQKNTKMDLKKRVHSLDYSNPLDYHDVVVEIDGYRFSKIDFENIQYLSQILQANKPEQGSFELNNLKITVLQLEEYQNQLIKL